MDFFTLFSPDGVMLETNVVCIVIALMFLYTFVGICAGFGGGLTAIQLVTLMLPVKMATPLSVIVGTATALYATWLSRKETDWRSAMVLIIFSFLGIPSVYMRCRIYPTILLKVGFRRIPSGISFYSLFIPRLPFLTVTGSPSASRYNNSALSTFVSRRTARMVIYGMLRNLGPAAFRGTLNAFFTANDIAVIGGLATSGILTVSIFKLVLFCIPTMILGSLVGQYVHKRISVKVFRVMVFLLLIASGSMLIKGALGIPAAAALLPPFTLLVILQLAFGKKVAAIRRAEESK
ncbi:TSUP family transporter [Escherichia coli]